MADTNIEIIYFLRHYFKICYKVAEVARKIQEVKGNDAISDCTAQKFSNFLRDVLK